MYKTEYKGNFKLLTYPNRIEFFGAQSYTAMERITRDRAIEFVREVPLSEWKFTSSSDGGNPEFSLKSGICEPYFIVLVDPLEMKILKINLVPSSSCLMSHIKFGGPDIDNLYAELVQKIKNKSNS